MTVRLCPVCGRLNLADFRYCPYCGEPAARGPGLAEALEDPFRRLDALGAERRFVILGEKLDLLEAEFELLASRHCKAVQEGVKFPPRAGAT